MDFLRAGARASSDPMGLLVHRCPVSTPFPGRAAPAPRAKTAGARRGRGAVSPTRRHGDVSLSLRAPRTQPLRLQFAQDLTMNRQSRCSRQSPRNSHDIGAGAVGPGRRRDRRPAAEKSGHPWRMNISCGAPMMVSTNRYTPPSQPPYHWVALYTVFFQFPMTSW